jgi:hypothetical protein
MEETSKWNHCEFEGESDGQINRVLRNSDAGNTYLSSLARKCHSQERHVKEDVKCDGEPAMHQEGSQVLQRRENQVQRPDKGRGWVCWRDWKVATRLRVLVSGRVDINWRSIPSREPPNLLVTTDPSEASRSLEMEPGCLCISHLLSTCPSLFSESLD